jgi:divalent metal cation (Fe/Co/Zn/Cd) transporter
MISTGVMALTGWLWVDMVAALVVVLLIGKAAWDIVQSTGRVLVDTAPYAPDDLSAIVHDVPGVQAIQRVRSRGPLDSSHIDVDVKIAPEMTTDQSNSIAHAIRQRLHHHLDGVQEIEVHFSPHYPQGRNPMLTARAYADALGLGTHDVHLSYEKDDCVLEMHVEVPFDLTLEEAHRQVSQLERDIRQALPNLQRVVTHIEPAPRVDHTPDNAALQQRATDIQEQVHEILDAQYPQVGWHDITARAMTRGFAANLHATLPAQMSVEAAHVIVEEAERSLRDRLPELAKITIHAEPHDHGS